MWVKKFIGLLISGSVVMLMMMGMMMVVIRVCYWWFSSGSNNSGLSRGLRIRVSLIVRLLYY